MPERYLFPVSGQAPNLNPLAALNSQTQALEATAQDSFVVITGSLYLVGEALELLKINNVAINERGLNEWAAFNADLNSASVGESSRLRRCETSLEEELFTFIF